MSMEDDIAEVRAETKDTLIKQIDKFFDELVNLLYRAEDSGAMSMQERAEAACYSNRTDYRPVDEALKRAQARIAALPLRVKP